MEAHEIVNQVQEAFKKLASQMSKLFGKTSEWYNSHGREPKTQNPIQSGNVSPVTHYMQFARQYEAAQNGAGKMLNRRVYEELEMEFTADSADSAATEQKEHHASVLKESFDVLDGLNKKEFTECSSSELTALEEEAAQLRDVASDLVSHLRAIRKLRGVK
ncbi:MAG: hypothetical protein LUM44_17810 [Pyrinomonadaceae bacterium]|nr:hypothetical protein [Pyrinomonadaceae bacterium]